MPGYLRVIGWLVLIISPLGYGAETLRLIFPAPGSLAPVTISQYYERALVLALEKTAPRPTVPNQPPEKIELDYYESSAGRERFRLLIKKGVVDVIWSTTTKKREAEMAAVKFNLLRGINEYHLLLIRDGEQHRFDQVYKLEDLRQFKIGSGSQWSDAEIYRHNGLTVVTSYTYNPLFRMLAAKRFDYLARGLHEIDQEVEKFGKLGLVREKNLVIHFSQPVHFFLRKQNQALAERIERGLHLAQADGSLDELFFSVPMLRAAEEKMRLLDRRIIKLERSD